MLASWTMLAMLPCLLTADEAKICLSSSMLIGVDPDDALAATRPMVKLLGRNVSFPVSVYIADAHDLKGLESLAKETSAGTHDVVAIWGIEYGWLKKKFPELKLLTSVYVGSDVRHEVGYNVLLLVSQNAKYKQLADLQGKKLARYHRQALMVEFSLENMLRDENLPRQGFFQEVKSRYPTAKDAVAAIRNGAADCLGIDVATWGHLQGTQPGLANKVVVFAHGPTLPPVVLVGRPNNLERLRAGLWKKLQDELAKIHTTEEGKQCVRFWGIQKFQRSDEVKDKRDFEDLLDRSGRDLLEWSDRFYGKPK